MFTINVTMILTNHRLNFSIRPFFTVIDLIDYKTGFNSWTDNLASEMCVACVDVCGRKLIPRMLIGLKATNLAITI